MPRLPRARMIGDDVLNLVCTTTSSPQTITIQRLTPGGSSVTINWGDGTVTTVSSGYSSTITHTYATAGRYEVSLTGAGIITYLDLRAASAMGCANGNIRKLTNLTYLYLSTLPQATVGAGEIGALTKLTYLTLNSLTQVTVGAGEIGALTKLTYLYLSTLPQATVGAGEIGALTKLTSLYLSAPTQVTVGAGEIGALTKLTYLNLNSLPQVTVGAGEIGALTNLTYLYLINSSHIAPLSTDLASLTLCKTWQYENNLTQAQVDAVLAAIYGARATYQATGATPTLDLLGTGNAAPSGIYQDATPPTTGKEFAYALVNDPRSEGFKKWSITTA